MYIVNDTAYRYSRLPNTRLIYGNEYMQIVYAVLPFGNRFIIDINLMSRKKNDSLNRSDLYRSAGIIWVVANFVGHSAHVGGGAVCQSAINTLSAASWLGTNGYQ